MSVSNLLDLDPKLLNSPPTPIMVYKEWCSSPDTEWQGNFDPVFLHAPIHVLLEAPDPIKAVPVVKQKVWSREKSEQLLSSFEHYKENLLASSDAKVVEYYQSMIQAGTFPNLDPTSDYLPGQIGRSCSVPTFTYDQQRQTSNSYQLDHTLLAENVQLVQGVPIPFWNINIASTAGEDRSSASAVPKVKSKTSSSARVSTAPLKAASASAKRSTQDDNAARQWYHVHNITNHEKIGSTYQFWVIWEPVGEQKQGEENWQPYTNVRTCQYLFNYINNSHDESLKRWFKKKKAACVPPTT
jgi:hypothetical protein